MEEMQRIVRNNPSPELAALVLPYTSEQSLPSDPSSSFFCGGQGARRPCLVACVHHGTAGFIKRVDLVRVLARPLHAGRTRGHPRDCQTCDSGLLRQ